MRAADKVEALREIEAEQVALRDELTRGTQAFATDVDVLNGRIAVIRHLRFHYSALALVEGGADEQNGMEVPT